MNALQLAGLIPVGALFGTELGTLMIHRALFELPTDQHLASEQAIQRILGRVMPPYMIVAIAGAIVAALAADGSPATALGAAGVGCLLVMLAATLRGNVPIKQRDRAVATWGGPGALAIAAATLDEPARDAGHARRLRVSAHLPKHRDCLMSRRRGRAA